MGGGRVRSRVTVGNGAEAERVAKLGAQEAVVLLASKLFGVTSPSALGIDPESSIDAAADVVDAMATAAGGSGWLCWPSYVVINIVRSSAHLCTC